MTPPTWSVVLTVRIDTESVAIGLKTSLMLNLRVSWLGLPADPTRVERLTVLVLES
jgi:hypothetical protein